MLESSHSSRGSQRRRSRRSAPPSPPPSRTRRNEPAPSFTNPTTPAPGERSGQERLGHREDRKEQRREGLRRERLEKRKPRVPPAPSRSSAAPTGQMPSVEGQATHLRKPREKRVRRSSPLVHLVRLLILGVGVGAIAGTFLSVWNPALNRPASVAQVQAASAAGMNQAQADGQPTAALTKGQELTALTARVVPLTQGLQDLTPGVFLIDLDSGDYFTLNGTSSFSAASMIKVPILVALLQEVDAGRVRLDEKIVLQQADLAEGSGEMQYAPVGSEYTVLETITNMIVISDNTATNMIIRRLGGIEPVNQRFRKWGMQQTALRKLLPDLQGTNTTSPKELSTLLAMVSQGDLLSMKSRDRALDIMRHTVTDTLLPASLGVGATISHKTGDIGSLVGDTGIIDMPNGKRYAITAMVKRPFNDDRAQDLIRQVAASVYEYLNQVAGGQSSAEQVVPTAAPSPAATNQDVPSSDTAAPSADVPADSPPVDSTTP